MIYVVRPGHTDWNVEEKTQGNIDTELNETGISQAKGIKNELLNIKLDVILCGLRNRCKSTAGIICKGRNIPIVEVEDLREREFGEFEGNQKNIDYNWVQFWS